MEPPAGRFNWTEVHRGEDRDRALESLLAVFRLCVRGGHMMPELILTADPAGQRVAVRATWTPAA